MTVNKPLLTILSLAVLAFTGCACDDACGPLAGHFCKSRGGGKYYPPQAVTCTSVDVRPRNSRNTDLGFRCCLD